jgi:hypothetical protein
MDSIYQANLHPASMGAVTRFSAISLEGNPQLLEKGPVKLKLFFESDKEDRYAEIYLNIDWTRSRLHLKEKDPDYRGAVVHALAGNAGRVNCLGVLCRSCAVTHSRGTKLSLRQFPV